LAGGNSVKRGAKGRLKKTTPKKKIGHCQKRTVSVPESNPKKNKRRKKKRGGPSGKQRKASNPWEFKAKTRPKGAKRTGKRKEKKREKFKNDWP